MAFTKIYGVFARKMTDYSWIKLYRKISINPKTEPKFFVYVPPREIYYQFFRRSPEKEWFPAHNVQKRHVYRTSALDFLLNTGVSPNKALASFAEEYGINILSELWTPWSSTTATLTSTTTNSATDVRWDSFATNHSTSTFMWTANNNNNSAT